MSSQNYKGISSNLYIPGKELGRGGEGSVFEIAGDDRSVLKVYHEALDDDKDKKLRHMLSIANPQIERNASWPVDLVMNGSGKVSGFVMKKLSGCVPLHMLFSPMDRKKLFPDKGYDFLIHVARNLAGAFQNMHNAGLVVGDINEGNILIDAAGRVNFIDCDSFQIKNGTQYHFCEVGVPRYTPPELLDLGSFDQVVRTTNTDSFSMSVLFFQLLFMGRHPFAGVNVSSEDIDEETAIKRNYFAYSLTNRANKLSPPKDSFDIRNLPIEVTGLFTRSFESRTDRPKEAEWIDAFGYLLGNLEVCKDSKIHRYPNHLSECPWCLFKEKRGINFFLDDSYVKNHPELSNIEAFVNGFRVERINFSAWAGSTLPKPVSANPVPEKYGRYKNRYIFTAVTIVLATIFLAMSLNAGYIVVGVIALVSAPSLLPWGRAIKAEGKARKALSENYQQKYRSLVIEYNATKDTDAYNEHADKFAKQIQAFSRFPAEFQKAKADLEEKLYNEQLYTYLAKFDIAYFNIPSFGATRKLALYTAGIRNAADISKLKSQRIQGIGPKYTQNLFDLQRHMISSFDYIPDKQKMASGLNIIIAEMTSKKNRLENEIRAEFLNLDQFKRNILARKAQLRDQLATVEVALLQAQLDYQEFKRIAFQL